MFSRLHPHPLFPLSQKHTDNVEKVIFDDNNLGPLGTARLAEILPLKIEFRELVSVCTIRLTYIIVYSTSENRVRRTGECLHHTADLHSRLFYH